MMNQNKMRATIIAGVTLLAMLLLSAGLSQIKLESGQPVNLGNITIQGGSYGALFKADFIVYFIYGVYIVSAIAVVIIAIYMLLTPERRRKLLRFLATFLPVAAIALFLANYIPNCSGQTVQQTLAPGGSQPTPNVTNVPISTFSPTSSSSVLLITTIVLALVFSVLVVWIIFRLRQEHPIQTTPLMRLADQAQIALDTLHAGGDLKNVILRCYFDMCRVLIEQRSLRRERSMTPHEFEESLVANGLPSESVHLLTHLFEEVRYGVKLPGRSEEYMAETSLRAIIDACKVAH